MDLDEPYGGSLCGNLSQKKYIQLFSSSSISLNSSSGDCRYHSLHYDVDSHKVC